MDPQLLKMVAEEQGEFTRALTDGFHMHDLERGQAYLEDACRNMLKPLAQKGYYFDGIEIVDPLEFYDGITRPGQGTTSSSTKEFEIARNSFFGVRIKHHFKDPATGIVHELKCPFQFLPYTNQHGDIWVRNSLYGLQYVLAERGPSVDVNGKETRIFVRVTGYRFNVTKELHTFNRVHRVMGGAVTNAMNMTLPANRFYSSRGDRQIKNKRVPIPLLAWYIFGKYGLHQAMKEFGECDYRIDTLDTLLDTCSEKDGWEIYSNTGAIHYKAFERPRGAIIQEDPAIAVRSLTKSGEISNLALQYVGGLLFMFAVFSHELDVTRLNDINYWRLLIGRCSIKLPLKTQPDVYLRQMNEHFASVEEYADDLTIDRYNKFDLDVHNTYDLLNHLMLNYSNLIKLYDPADMLHKELSSMEFLYDYMIKQVNDFKFKIRNKTLVTPKTINREIDTCFRLFNIDHSVRENNVCLEQTGTDNPFIDYGLGVILQTRSTVGKKGTGRGEFDPNHPGSVIHESQPFVCSYQCASKPSPDARGMLLPRVHLVQGRFTSLRPEDRPLYNQVKHRLHYRE